MNTGDGQTLKDGTIIVPDSETVDGRYRHTFVDVLHEAFLDKTFPPLFAWGPGGEATKAAAFLDQATALMNELLVPLIQRMASPSALQLEVHSWGPEGWHLD